LYSQAVFLPSSPPLRRSLSAIGILLFCPPPPFWLFFFGADGVIRFCHRSRSRWNCFKGEGNQFYWPSLDSSSLPLAAEIKSVNISPTNHRNPLFGHRDQTDDILEGEGEQGQKFCWCMFRIERKVRRKSVTR
jgi:hypothetical protein